MKYPKSEQYDKQFLLENMMGPNAAWPFSESPAART